MRIGVLAAAALVLATAACGHETTSPRGVDGSGTEDGVLAGPPPLTVQRPEGEVELTAYSWCFHDAGTRGCADGAPPARLPRTSTNAPLTFTFPLDGWTFTAAFRRPGPPATCDRIIGARLVAQGDGSFVVPAPVRAGTWEVDVSGSSGSGDSLATGLAWTTTADSATALPARGDLTFLGPPTTSSGTGEAYGPSLTLTGLPADPVRVSAELVVEGASGTATFPLHVAGRDTCPDDGTVVLAGDDPNTPVDLSSLGGPPYAHRVTLTLDGTEHVGTARWPDDLSPAMSNQLGLTWSPPLPAWGTSR